jgi:hypothetical protein
MKEFVLDMIRYSFDAATLTVLCSFLIGYLGYACHWQEKDPKQDAMRAVIACSMMFLPSLWFWFGSNKASFDWPLVGITFCIGLVAYAGLQFGSKHQSLAFTSVCFLIMFIGGNVARHYINDHIYKTQSFVHK